MAEPSSDCSRVWLITGCSSGFGRALAEAALAAGHRVVATARKPEALADLEQLGAEAGACRAVALDVTDEAQAHAAVATAVEAFGRLDVLVNNAGHGLIGAVEEVSDAQARQLFDTNVFGLFNVTRAALPVLRAQGHGHILNVSSVGGLVALLGSGHYCASKFAVEGISEALAEEVRPFGIRVTLIEPGAFRTDFAGRSIQQAPALGEVYAGTVGKRRAGLSDFDGKQPGDPAKAAQAMLAVAEQEDPPLPLVLGADALKRAREKVHALTRDLDASEEAALNVDFLDTPEERGEHAEAIAAARAARGVELTRSPDRHAPGLHHVAIRADDYDATLRFYTETLGFRVRHVWSFPAMNIQRGTFLDAGDGSTYVELFDREAHVGAEGRPRRPGEEVVTGALLHFALRVPDAGAAYERALAAGARLHTPPVAFTYGEPPLSARIALVYSPNGEVIEFFENDDL